MSPLQTTPYVLQSQAGLFLQAWVASVSIKATSEQTGGAFNLFEVTCPPAYSTPLVIHYAEDVAIYVLHGTLQVFCGSATSEAATGSFFYQPRGTPHGFRVKSDTAARLLCMTVPAGFDRFLLVDQIRVAGSEQEMMAARYKIEVLGPLPK